jgi:hypothetical protein
MWRNIVKQAAVGGIAGGTGIVVRSAAGAVGFAVGGPAVSILAATASGAAAGAAYNTVSKAIDEFLG